MHMPAPLVQSSRVQKDPVTERRAVAVQQNRTAESSTQFVAHVAELWTLDVDGNVRVSGSLEQQFSICRCNQNQNERWKYQACFREELNGIERSTRETCSISCVYRSSFVTESWLHTTLRKAAAHGVDENPRIGLPPRHTKWWVRPIQDTRRAPRATVWNLKHHS